MPFDTSRLDVIGLLDLDDSAGKPLQVPIELIDEDPHQPRIEFDNAALQELADTIAERGVRQPISVRPHPNVPSRWMLNFGARRLRASKLAGMDHIPTFVDETADSYDQVIENEQREGLKPLELALFVQRRLAAGDTQAEIARRLGKGRAYVTYAMALIDAPDWLMAAYREGRCRGLRELYELRQMHTDHPQYVETWASGQGTITRDRLASLKASLATDAGPIPVMAAVEQTTTRQGDGIPGASGGKLSRPVVPIAVAKAISITLHAELQGEPVELIVDAVPLVDGQVYVQGGASGVRRAVSASSLTLVRITAG